MFDYVLYAIGVLLVIIIAIAVLSQRFLSQSDE